jgi:hypothetical protein
MRLTKEWMENIYNKNIFFNLIALINFLLKRLEGVGDLEDV